MMCDLSSHLPQQAEADNAATEATEAETENAVEANARGAVEAASAVLEAAKRNPGQHKFMLRMITASLEAVSCASEEWAGKKKNKRTAYAAFDVARGRVPPAKDALGSAEEEQKSSAQAAVAMAQAAVATAQAALAAAQANLAETKETARAPQGQSADNIARLKNEYAATVDAMVKTKDAAEEAASTYAALFKDLADSSNALKCLAAAVTASQS
jgi:hypothetical protein